MTDVLEVDSVPEDANWLVTMRRRTEAGERPPPPRLPPTPEQALAAALAAERAMMQELAYPGQPRDRRGRFGSGGGTRIGVSRERPDLGGSDIHTYGDIVAARRNPVIAEAERTTSDDLERLGIDVASQRQVAGVFEGGGEPSLSVVLGKGATVEDVDIAGAYLVRRNQQDSVIVTVGGREMERLGLQPNATAIRIEGLSTDPARREEIMADIQQHTPFASWDEKRGTVTVAAFHDDLDQGMRDGLLSLADKHGARMSAENVHERWYFHDDEMRTDATAYLHPRDTSVLRTPAEVRRQYPGDRTDAIPGPRPGSSGSDVGGGAGAGAEGAHVRDHPAGAFTEGLAFGVGIPFRAFDPNQPRRADGRWGKGGARPSGGGPSPLEPGPDGFAPLETATGIRLDDTMNRRFKGDAALGVEAAIMGVHERFPGALNGVVLKCDIPVGDQTTAAATKSDGSVIVISPEATKRPAFYDPNEDHDFSAGGDTIEGVLVHEGYHAVLDHAGGSAVNEGRYASAYTMAKDMPFPTEYSKQDTGNGKERAAELLTQAHFGQDKPDARRLYDAVKKGYKPKPVTGHWGQQVMVLERAYDPNQPRRADGRWGRGGATPVRQHTEDEDVAFLSEHERRLEAAGVDVPGAGMGPAYSELRLIDRRLVPEVTAGVEAMAKAYPGIRESGTTVLLRVRPLPVGRGAQTDSESLAVTDPKGRHQTEGFITLNQLYWENKDDMDALMRTGQKGWLVDNTPAGMVKHEMGHIADGVLQASADEGYRRAAEANPTTGVSGYADSTYVQYIEDPDTPKERVQTAPAYHERFAEQAVDIMRGGRTKDPTPDYTIAEAALGKLR